jgi:hypothetical protein
MQRRGRTAGYARLGQFLSLPNIAENSATFDYIAGLGCNRQKSALSELRGNGCAGVFNVLVSGDR